MFNFDLVSENLNYIASKMLRLDYQTSPKLSQFCSSMEQARLKEDRKFDGFATSCFCL